MNNEFGCSNSYNAATFSLYKGGKATLAFSTTGNHTVKSPVTEGISTFNLLRSLGNGGSHGEFVTFFSLSAFTLLSQISHSDFRKYTGVKPIVNSFATYDAQCNRIGNLFWRPNRYYLICDFGNQIIVALSLWFRVLAACLVVRLCRLTKITTTSCIATNFTVNAGTMPMEFLSNCPV